VLDTRGGIVYTAYGSAGRPTLYRLEAGSSKSTALGAAGGPGAGGGVAVTPDGRYVIFNASAESPLYRANSDGTGLFELVPRNAGGAAVTPDGRTVLYSPWGSPGLFRVPIEGGPPRQLIDRFVGGEPIVSPDGQQILFKGGEPGTVILCRLPDCTHLKELKLKSAKWAPDGQGVAYVNEQDRGNLWEQFFDGRPPRALTDLDDAQILEFAWSPDYKRLAIARGRVSHDLVLLKGLR
jgi:Tol biopolymer transport system component